MSSGGDSGNDNGGGNSHPGSSEGAFGRAIGLNRTAREMRNDQAYQGSKHHRRMGGERGDFTPASMSYTQMGEMSPGLGMTSEKMNVGHGGYAASGPARRAMLRNLEARINAINTTRARLARDRIDSGIGLGGYAPQTRVEALLSQALPGVSAYSLPGPGGDFSKGRTAFGVGSPGNLVGTAAGMLTGVTGMGAVGGIMGREIGQALGANGVETPAQKTMRERYGTLSGRVDMGNNQETGERADYYPEAPTVAPTPAEEAAAVVPAAEEALSPWDEKRSWWEGNTFRLAPLTRGGK